MKTCIFFSLGNFYARRIFSIQRFRSFFLVVFCSEVFSWVYLVYTVVVQLKHCRTNVKLFFQLVYSVQLFPILLILWCLCWTKKRAAQLHRSLWGLDSKVYSYFHVFWIKCFWHSGEDCFFHAILCCSCFMVCSAGVWKGLFARIIMIGTLTALQWFIYDSVKVYFRLPRPPPPEMPESLKKKLGLTE